MRPRGPVCTARGAAGLWRGGPSRVHSNASREPATSVPLCGFRSPTLRACQPAGASPSCIQETWLTLHLAPAQALWPRCPPTPPHLFGGHTPDLAVSASDCDLHCEVREVTRAGSWFPPRSSSALGCPGCGEPGCSPGSFCHGRQADELTGWPRPPGTGLSEAGPEGWGLSPPPTDRRKDRDEVRLERGSGATRADQCPGWRTPASGQRPAPGDRSPCAQDSPTSPAHPGLLSPWVPSDANHKERATRDVPLSPGGVAGIPRGHQTSRRLAVSTSRGCVHTRRKPTRRRKESFWLRCSGQLIALGLR